MPARSAGWNAVFIASQLSLRCHLHVCGVHAETNAVFFALHTAVRIEDCYIVYRLDVLTEQRMAEAEMPDEIHLLLQRCVCRKLGRGLRRREKEGGLELLFVRSNGVIGSCCTAAESLCS